MEQTMSAYDLNSNFTQTAADYNEKIALKSDITSVYTKTQVDNFRETINADYTAKLELKANEDETIKIYESPLEKRTVDHPFKAGTVNQLSLSSTFIDSVNAKEPEFITVSPILKNLNFESGKIELMLSSAFTDLVDTKTDENQVQTIVNAYAPYTFEAPLEINENRSTGERRLRMGASYSQDLLAKASVVSLTALANDINSRLAGQLTPEEILITSNSWPQVQITNTSDTDSPSEIAFNRQIKNQYFKSAMGVAGDLTRGAFWWAGGQDRININCQTGMIRMRNGLEVPSLKTDIIEGLSTTTVRIENNAVITGNVNIDGYTIVQGSFLVAGATTMNSNVQITGNLTASGTITASNSNPFWVAGKVSANGNAIITNKGRYECTTYKTGTGFYTIYPPTNKPFPDTNYIVQLTCQVDGSNATVRVVHGSLSTTSFQAMTYLAGQVADCIFHFSVLA
jgi:hypothetical protein